jgi:hypothetical protein
VGSFPMAAEASGECAAENQAWIPGMILSGSLPQEECPVTLWMLANSARLACVRP